MYIYCPPESLIVTSYRLSLILGAAVLLVPAKLGTAGVILTVSRDAGPIGSLPIYWSIPSVGWYWTPLTQRDLPAVEARSTSSPGINAHAVFSEQLFAHGATRGGSRSGYLTWNGAEFVDGPWVRGEFASPASVVVGTRYVVGISGWRNARSAPNRGAGSNWAYRTLPSAETFGIIKPGESRAGN